MTDNRPRASREGAPIEDLGDGLLLRHAARADADALVAFNGDVHKRHDATEPAAGIAAWTRDLLERPHPTIAPDDFMVVVDTRTGAIVSSLNLISQTWTYGGVPFGVGQIELVGTQPDYRRRGLIRRQFEVVHRWSAERGELVQGITGISWYYRQFGYEYALALGGDAPIGRPDVPPLADGESEPYRVRPATPDDVPFLVELDEHARRRSLVACVRDAALWRYEVDGRNERDGERPFVAVIEDTAGGLIGCLAHIGQLREGTVWSTRYELAPGASWMDVTPSVLRYLARLGEQYEARPAAGRFVGLRLELNADHPAYRWLPGRRGEGRRPYSWYVRVADLPAFLRRVAPAIEAELAESEAAGLTGAVSLSFYRSGLRLAFERGRLVGAEPWHPVEPLADASFPDLTFLQVLFGYRSFDELRAAFPDCHARDERAAALIDALFPKRPSFVWHVN